MLALACALFSMVSSYLVHHGYCATATAFARATETKIQEDQASIKNRQSELLHNLRITLECRIIAHSKTHHTSFEGFLFRSFDTSFLTIVANKPYNLMHWSSIKTLICADRFLVNRSASLLSDRNPEAGAGRTGG